jgi:hypothetical protein
MAKKTVILHLARSTPGTHVYQEPIVSPAAQTFPTIYVKKGKFPSPPPQEIQVTIQIKESDVAGWED